MPLWARLRRGGENDGAGRRSHGREADGRPGSAQRNATEWEQGPGWERGATFERSENGGASTLPPAGATTGQPGFAAGEMRPNGSKGRGESGSRVWEKRKAPRCRGDDYESPTAYFLSIKKVGKER